MKLDDLFIFTNVYINGFLTFTRGKSVRERAIGDEGRGDRERERETETDRQSKNEKKSAKERNSKRKRERKRETV